MKKKDPIQKRKQKEKEIKKYLDQLNHQLKKKPFFLEIGAMDGIRHDKLYPLIKKYQWPGLLVEPLPDMFQRLLQNYQGHANLQFENSAITDKNEKKEIYRVPTKEVGTNNIPGWCDGISSFFLDRNAIGGMECLQSGKRMDPKIYQTFQNKIIKEEVSCITLDHLIKKYQIKQIDILQIDTEGSDYLIFKQIDFNRFKPYFIRLEVNNLPNHEYQEIIKTLEKFKYNYYLDHLDLIAFR